MNRASETALSLMLRKTYNKGWCESENWQLYDCYSALRLGKGVWRDIKARWDELVEDDDDKPRLGVVRDNEHKPVLFMYLNPSFETDASDTILTIEEMINGKEEK